MYTYKLGGMMITDELYHDDLDSMTFGRKDQNELSHSGIKGMSWHNRRFQNEDGSLTMAGRRRYGVGNPKIGVNVEVTDTGTGNRAAGAAAGYNAVIKPSGKSGGGSFNKTSAVNRQTFASSNRPQYSPRPSTGVSQTTRNLASNQISNINQRAANRVASNANSGKKAADDLFSKIGNAATGAFNSAKQWTNQAAQDVANTATNAYNGAREIAGQVGDWVEDRAKDVGEFVDQNITGNTARNNANELNRAANASGNSTSDNLRDQAAQQQNKADNSLFGRIGNAANQVGDWVGDRAKDVAGAATNAYNGARETANQVGDWLGDRAKDVSRAATNAFNGARETVDQVGDWVGDRAKDVSGAATNAFNGARETVDKVGDWVGDRARDAGQAAQNLARTVSNVDERKAAEDAQAAADRQLMLARANSGYVTPDGNEYIGRLQDAFNVDSAERAADEARRAYENHPLTKAENWIGDRVNDVTRTAQNVRDWGNQAIDNVKNGNVANDIANWGKQAYGDASKWVGNAVNDIGRTATNAYNDASKWVGDRARDAGQAAQNLARTVSNVDERKAAEDAQAAADRQLMLARANSGYVTPDGNEYIGRLQDAFNVDSAERAADEARRAYENHPLTKAENWIGDRANDVGRTATNAYNDASRWVGNAANDVGRTATNAYNDASKWVGNAARDVGNWTTNAARDVGGWTNQAARDVANWGSGAINSGRQAIDNLFGGGKKKKK